MTFSDKERQLALELKDDLTLLKKSLEVLMYSYDQCKDLIEKTQRTPEEEEKIEALTARFARTTDLLTQKIIKSIFILLKEEVIGFIDRANFLEQMKVIDDAQPLIDLRSLRNEIAHEYSSNLKGISESVFHQILLLKGLIEAIKTYLNDSFPFKDLLR